MSYRLTSTGKSLAERIQAPDAPDSGVLVYLYTHDDPNGIEVDELVGELHSTETIILRVISRLLNSNHIKEI